MQVIHSMAELRSCRLAMTGSVGFVPTMGNLHAGHIALVEALRQRCDQVIVSIFVNPMQFDESSDLAAYPRTLQADIEKLQAVGVDLLFLPNEAEIYPEGVALHTRVDVPMVSEMLEGACRPGHFSGVATVVCKLLNLVQADVAAFGKKDYQQLLVIRKLAQDLALNIEILGIDTLREADGLAMSSRNSRLSASERQLAPLLYQTLQQVCGQLGQGIADFQSLEIAATQRLTKAGFEPEYFKICSTDDLQPPTALSRLVILVAARLGSIRLIDNIEI